MNWRQRILIVILGSAGVNPFSSETGKDFGNFVVEFIAIWSVAMAVVALVSYVLHRLVKSTKVKVGIFCALLWLIFLVIFSWPLDLEDRPNTMIMIVIGWAGATLLAAEVFVILSPFLVMMLTFRYLEAKAN